MYLTVVHDGLCTVSTDDDAAASPGHGGVADVDRDADAYALLEAAVHDIVQKEIPPSRRMPAHFIVAATLPAASHTDPRLLDEPVFVQSLGRVVADSTTGKPTCTLQSIAWLVSSGSAGQKPLSVPTAYAPEAGR